MLQHVFKSAPCACVMCPLACYCILWHCCWH